MKQKLANRWRCLRRVWSRAAGFLFLLLTATANCGWAQQNLFNIPSGDITPEQHSFYQHQLNLFADKFESKGHFTYGLKNRWEVGVNLVGKGLYFAPDVKLLYNSNPQRAALFPWLLATAQKQWRPGNKVFINAGVQGGVSISNRLYRKRPGYFGYATGTFLFGKGSRIVGGLYHGNRMLLGPGSNTGAMAGYELKLHKRWYLMGDWISGNNDGSVAVVGGMFNAGKRVQLCAGWMVPNPGVPKPAGLVLEVNLLGWDAY